MQLPLQAACPLREQLSFFLFSFPPIRGMIQKGIFSFLLFDFLLSGPPREKATGFRNALRESMQAVCRMKGRRKSYHGKQTKNK